MDRDTVMSRIRRGEWVTSGEAAIALGVSRRTAINMIDDGRLSWRWHSGGRIREVDPAAITAALEAARAIHRGRTDRDR